MTWDQYWYGDPLMVRDYREADRLRLERKNAECHLMGMYIYEALCDASPLYRDLLKKNKPVPFRTEPYPLFKKEKAAADREQEVKNERLKAQLFFKNWARAAAKKFA